MEQFCEVAKGFKDLWFLTNYSLLKFAFFNPFLGQTQTAEARGKPWSLTWKKKSNQALRDLFHLSDVGQKQPEGSDSFLTHGLLPNLRLPVWGPAPCQEGSLKEGLVASHGSGDHCLLDFTRPSGEI